MVHIRHTILPCILVLFCVLDATGQSVRKIADVNFRDSLYRRVSPNGQYVAYALDSTGVRRTRTYPTRSDDTIQIPDSVFHVLMLGVTNDATFLTYESRASGLVHLAAIPHNETTWRELSSVLPPQDPELGNLFQWPGNCIAVTGYPTVVIYGIYLSQSAPQKASYRTLIVNTQTYEVLQTYQGLIIDGVRPGGKEFYSRRIAPDSQAYLCTYYDGSTGAALKTIRIGSGYSSPTGFDHIMYNSRMIGNVDEAPMPIVEAGSFVAGCVMSPNVYCVNRYDQGKSTLELLDLVTSKRTYIDTSGSVLIDHADSIIIVLNERPTRIRVYKIDSLVQKEGFVCLRERDTAVVYQSVTYGAIYLGQKIMNDVVATIEGQEYKISGRQSPLILKNDSVGSVPFSAVAREAGGGVLYRDTLVPLTVRYPGAYIAATRTAPHVRELALSADEESIAVVSDSTTTIVPLHAGVAPSFDDVRSSLLKGASLHTTQSELLPADSHIEIHERHDDPGQQQYHHTLDQVVVRAGADTTVIRSLYIPPDMYVAGAASVTGVSDRLLGMCVYRYGTLPGRLYLTQYRDGMWQPIGDTNGIEIPANGAADLSIPGHVVATGENYQLVMKRLDDTASLINVRVMSLPAIVVNDSTILTTQNYMRSQQGKWVDGPYLPKGYAGVDVKRVSTLNSVMIVNEPWNTGYLLNNATMSVERALGRGFDSATCAVYSRRYHGLFVGHHTGILGFLPLMIKDSTATDVSLERQATAANGVIACSIFTLTGAHMREVTCSRILTYADVREFDMPSGLYLMVYHLETGMVVTQPMIVWKE